MGVWLWRVVTSSGGAEDAVYLWEVHETRAQVWWEAEGLMARQSAAKPCVKKKLAGPGKCVPDPMAGIRNVEPFSLQSPAPAQPWLGSWCHVAEGG